MSQHTTKVLYEHGDNDYYDFYNSFTGEGFSLLLNMAQGGVMPGGLVTSQSCYTSNIAYMSAISSQQGDMFAGTHDTFVDGQPQFMEISSVKVYGF